MGDQESGQASKTMHGSGTTHFTVVIVVLLASMTSAWLDDQSLYAYKKESFLSTEKCYRSKTECIMPMSSQPTSFCYFRCRCAGHRTGECKESSSCGVSKQYRCICKGPRGSRKENDCQSKLK